MNLGRFVAPPDGTRVAVVESDTDAVAVVEVRQVGSNWFLPLTRTEVSDPSPRCAEKMFLASIRKAAGRVGVVERSYRVESRPQSGLVE